MRYNNGGFVRGTAKAMSERFWDDTALEWVQIYVLTGITVPTRDFFNAGQTGARADDRALMEAELSGDDVFRLSYDNDNAYGFGGGDRMFGYGGGDTLRGGDGFDRLFGGFGRDKMFGDAGRDQLNGGAGNDNLRGGADNDSLRGGSGRDQVFGGNVQDLFVFRDGDDVDVIRDFQTARQAHDRIDLSGLTSVISWWDLKNNHMTQDGNSVRIDDGDGTSCPYGMSTSAIC